MTLLTDKQREFLEAVALGCIIGESQKSKVELEPDDRRYYKHINHLIGLEDDITVHQLSALTGVQLPDTKSILGSVHLKLQMDIAYNALRLRARELVTDAKSDKSPESAVSDLAEAVDAYLELTGAK